MDARLEYMAEIRIRELEAELARQREVAQGLYEALKEVRDTIQALIDGGYYGYVDQRRRIDIALAAADGEVE